MTTPRLHPEDLNHPDAVCSLHGLPCHEPGEVLIERDALRSRLGMLTPGDANFDWEEWPGGWPEILSAYGTQFERAEKAEVERDALRAEVEALRANAPTNAAADVLAERRRQIESEGWTPEHDDDHDLGQLAEAAACYAAASADPEGPDVPFDCLPYHWPWAREWWKPSSDGRRMLVKAGALLLAEIERLERLASDQEVKP